jgi:hypothetical protein
MIKLFSLLISSKLVFSLDCKCCEPLSLEKEELEKDWESLTSQNYRMGYAGVIIHARPAFVHSTLGSMPGQTCAFTTSHISYPCLILLTTFL